MFFSSYPGVELLPSHPTHSTALYYQVIILNLPQYYIILAQLTPPLPPSSRALTPQPPSASQVLLTLKNSLQEVVPSVNCAKDEVSAMRNFARSANGQDGLSYQSRTLTRRLNHLENFLKKNNQQYLLLKISINETHSVQFLQGAVPLLVSFLQRKVNQLRIGADRMSQLAQKMAW